MAERPKEVSTDAANDSDFENRVRRLCERLEVPFDIPKVSRWALIGEKLASDEPELKPRKRRGRRKGGHYPFDQKVLDVIEDVAISQQLDFEVVLQAVLKHPPIKEGLGDADRTTHPKRLRSLFADRCFKRVFEEPTLANALKYCVPPHWKRRRDNK